MRGYLRRSIHRMLGISRLLREVLIVSSNISDIKASVDAIATSVAALGTSIATVLTTLQQLQQNAGNPASATTLTPDDQAALDAAVAEAATVQQALANLQSSLPAAQAAANAAPTT